MAGNVFDDIQFALADEQQKDSPANQAQWKAGREKQHSQEAEVHSIDVNLPGDMSANVVRHHVTRGVVRAMMAVNMLLLCGASVYCTEMGDMLQHGIPRKGRNAFDAAGKFVLSMKLLSLGVNESQIYIDSAQAAGPCGTSDGFIPGSGKYIEIKGARAKSRGDRMQGADARKQYAACDIRNGGWSLLTLVARERDPNDWTSVAEYDACGFWLGLVRREEFDHARTAAGIPNDMPITVVVSPFTEGQRIRRPGSRLSPHVRWIRCQDLTRDWCAQHLLQ